MADPVAGLSEIARVTRPGGTVAVTVWDFAGGTAPLSVFWRAAQHDAQLALAGLRELAQGIHPTVLADRGLVDAIEDRTARLPIAVTVHADPHTRSGRFTDAIEGAAFFAVSEALANVLKHAHTDRADVHLTCVDGELRVEVVDHGCGFDPATVDSAGLPGLVDRIEALGGGLSVHSRVGSGTVLTARLPARTRGNQRA